MNTRNFVMFAFCSVLWLGAVNAAETSGMIDAEEAGRIALEQTGGGQIMEIKRQGRGGPSPYYRLEIAAPDGYYHVQVDATNGKIFHFLRKGGAVSVPAGGLTGGVLSREQALALALSQSGGGTVVESEVDYKKNGRIIHEFEIINNGIKYDIEIDGHSGQVVEFKQKTMKGWLPAVTAAPAPAVEIVRPVVQPYGAGAGPARLTPADAQALAKEQAGGGNVHKYELDYDDGRLIHEITVHNNGVRHKFEIDDATGQVVEYSVKR